MKIKEIVIESFKSPFFNLLAIGNQILIALTTGAALPFAMSTPLGKAAILLNLPALVLSRVLVFQLSDAFVFIPPFIYLQWILIGAFAKFIASQFKLKAD